MRTFRPLLVALPSIVLGGVLATSLTTTAHAQGETPAERHAARTAEWEYSFYFCKDSDPCAQNAGKGAYEELNRLGDEGWEAYAYASKQGSGFNWELKRRK